MRLAMDVVYMHKVMKEMDASQIKIHRPKNELIWEELLYTPTSITSEIGRCSLDEIDRSLYLN
jgi:hypothetical protein